MTSVRKQNEAPLVQDKGREKAPYRLGMEAITNTLKKQLQFILQARNILKPVIKILLLVLMVIILLRDLIHENHRQSTPIGGIEVKTNQAIIERLLQYLLNIPTTLNPDRELAHETNDSYGIKSEGFDPRILA